jgi:hypothetical protein
VPLERLTEAGPSRGTDLPVAATAPEPVRLALFPEVDL